MSLLEGIVRKWSWWLYYLDYRGKGLPPDKARKKADWRNR
jgi:hypothetical protein